MGCSQDSQSLLLERSCELEIRVYSCERSTESREVEKRNPGCKGATATATTQSLLQHQYSGQML